MKISVNLEARTGSFETDMNRAAKAAEKRAKEMQRAFSRAGKVIGAGLAVGATAITLLVRNTLKANDALAKMSRSTGISTEALSQLQYAAGLSGVDDLSTSLNKFNRSIGEAAQGTAAQAEAFEAIGVSIKNAQGGIKSTEELLLDTADAFSQYEDGAAKSSVAQELFGRSGAALITFLNSGREGIEAMRKEADELGLTLDESTGRAAEQFNDNLDRMGKVSQGVGQRLANEFAPELARLTDLFVQAAKDGDTVARTAEGISAVFKGLTLAAITVSNAFQIVGKSLAGVAAIKIEFFSGNFRGAIEAGRAALSDIGGDLEDIRKAYDGLFNAQPGVPQSPVDSGSKRALTLPTSGGSSGKNASRSSAISEAEKQAQAIQRVIDALSEEAATNGLSRAQIEARSVAMLGATSAQTEQVYQLAEYIEAQSALNEKIAEAGAVFDATRTPLENFNKEIERLNALRDTFANGKPLIDPDTYERAVTQAQEQLNRLNQKTEEVADSMSVFADQAARNMQDAFADFLFDPFDKGLEGLLLSFETTLRKMVAQAAAAKIFDAFQGGEGGEGGGILGAIGSAIGKFFGGGKASGGPVAAGKTYLVGEQGPELFVSPTAGMIVPNSEISANSIVNNFSISAPQGTVSRATEQQIAAAAYRGAQRHNSRGN